MIRNRKRASQKGAFSFYFYPAIMFYEFNLSKKSYPPFEIHVRKIKE
jgi:hypothetical protein